jgi:CelD/BcsL family acetyltransferase involved in cellulose biosynthesis
MTFWWGGGAAACPPGWPRKLAIKRADSRSSFSLSEAGTSSSLSDSGTLSSSSAPVAAKSCQRAGLSDPRGRALRRGESGMAGTARRGAASAAAVRSWSFGVQIRKAQQRPLSEAQKKRRRKHEKPVRNKRLLGLLTYCCEDE